MKRKLALKIDTNKEDCANRKPNNRNAQFAGKQITA